MSQGSEQCDLNCVDWATEHYVDAVTRARNRDSIACVTVIPGYDDTKVRKPGLKVDRVNAQLYRMLWRAALDARPDWVLITSWNEWHEGSEIEPSYDLGDAYLNMTRYYARQIR